MVCGRARNSDPDGAENLLGREAQAFAEEGRGEEKGDRAAIYTCWRFLKRPGVLILVIGVCLAASPLYLDGLVIPSLANLWRGFRAPLDVVHKFLAGGASPVIFTVGCGLAIAGMVQMNRAKKRLADPQPSSQPRCKVPH